MKPKSERVTAGEIWHLAWPAILEMLFSTAVTYADTAMVGRLGAKASAAVGLTGSVGWLIGCIFSAIGVGVVACISRSIGAGQPERARTAAVQSGILALLLGAAVGGLAVALHKQVPVWMHGSDEILREAGEYFLIISLPMLFRAASILFGAVLRGAGDTRSPMRCNVTMNLVNVVLNFFLIYRTRAVTLGGLRLTIPGAGLGVRGAGIATAISVTVGGLLMLRAALRNPLVSMRGEPLRWNPQVGGEILRIGAPVVVQRLISCFGYIAFASLVARLGTVPLAANSIATSAEELFYIAGYGIQSASATLAGNALGMGSVERYRSLAKRSTLMTMGLLTCTGLLLFCFPVPLMSLFSSDSEVVRLGAEVLRIVALSEPMFGLMVNLEGLLNGIGDTTAPVVFYIVTMWGVRILFSAICILVLNLGLHAVWCCMVADNCARALLLLIRFLRGSWKKRFAAAQTV